MRVSSWHGTGAALSIAQVEGLWTLMSRYVDRDRGEFERKLRSASDVSVYQDGARVVGLAAGALTTAEVDGRPVSVVYMQWTHCDPSLRGGRWSAVAGMRLAIRAKLRHPLRPVYLLFAAATWKSYLIIARNAEHGWPLHGRQCAGSERVARSVMCQLESEDWDDAAGVLRGRGVWRYREGITPRGTTDPDIRLYGDLNPDQASGDCLAVCAPFSLPNLARFFRRHLRRALPAIPWRRSLS